jgi:hypothetical protein
VTDKNLYNVVKNPRTTHHLLNRRKKNMQDDYSCPILSSKSDQSDFKLDDIDIIDTEDKNTDGPSKVIEMKLRNVMTQSEMETLTTWFPKAAQTLAGVLRNRSH